MPLALSVPGWLIGLDVIEGDPSAPVRFESETTAGETVSATLTAREGGNEGLIELERRRSPVVCWPSHCGRVLVKSAFNRPGGIFVLTSPGTFSAAMNFATRLERETDALFVGEPTGGSPNHFGDAQFKQAPVSGMPYIISTLRWQDSTPFDERAWILPDLPAPPTFADFLTGTDAALAAALDHDAGNPPRDRVVRPWERPSQHGDWHFFFED